MKSCGTGPFSFSCELKPDFASDKICAGDKIVFDGLDLKKNNVLSYFIDLNAPHLQYDMYLLVDATGSMGTAISAAKSKFLNIVKSFDDYNDIRFGVGYYRDEAERGMVNGFRNQQPLTADIPKVTGAISRIVASGGGDGPEANLVALYKVATDSSIGWRSGSRKVVVWFGDWPGHEPTCVPGLPELNRNIVGKALFDKKITVVTVSFTTPGLDSNGRPPYAPITSYRCGKPGAGAGQASAIVKATSGFLVEEKDQAKLIEKIGSALNSLAKVFDYDNSDCIAKISDVHNPSLPLTVPAGTSSTVKHTLTLKSDACRDSEFECKYRYFESGAEIPPTTLKFVNVKGCAGS